MTDLIIKQIMPNGDCGVLIRFAESEHRLAAIHTLAANLIQAPLPAMINVIPATDSLVLVFATPVNFNSNLLNDMTQRCVDLKINQHPSKTHEIPVCYDPALATDVKSVCEALSLSHQQLIEYHTKSIYRVDMLGFLPGFAYLSGNHTALNLPRKNTPSLQVQAGSVAIANNQTGLYSLNSPGGWHVIGLTPILLLNWQNEQQPMALNPLDVVRFKSISSAEFKSIKAGSASAVDHYA